MFAAQITPPPRGIVSGRVQNVSTETLSIISDKPSYSVPQGSKVDFVLTPETMIFSPRARSGISDIQNYRRATVQYAVNGSRMVAIHIRLYEPIQVSTSQPPTLSHMAEAQEHIRRGDALQDQHNYEAAIAEYRKALALDTNYVNAHNNLGNALDELGRHDEAIQEYREAIRIMPPYALAHHNLAIALKRKGDLQGAAEQEALACAFDPKTYCPSNGSDANCTNGQWVSWLPPVMPPASQAPGSLVCVPKDWLERCISRYRTSPECAGAAPNRRMGPCAHPETSCALSWKNSHNK